MRKILVVIDMQNDFIDGSLGTKEAQQIVPRVVEKMKEYDPWNIYLTRDTHYENYLDTQEGRNLPIEKVLDIAGGRVWSGADALGIGLIDTYGGLKTAIALAVDKADLGDNYRVTEVTETPTGFAAFIASLNMSVREAFTRSELGLMMKDYNTVREAFRQQGVLMYSPYKVEIR